LIYINIHVFLRFVLGEKLFCKLGQEWAPKQLKAVIGEAGEMGGKAIGMGEVILLIFLDILVFILILAIFGALAVLYRFLYDTWLGWGIRVITPGI